LSRVTAWKSWPGRSARANPMTEATLVDAVRRALQYADALAASLREQLRGTAIAADANAVFRECMGLPGGGTFERW
jgi:hypothetical protein